MEVFVCAPASVFAGSKFSNVTFPTGSVVGDVLEQFLQQPQRQDFFVTRNGRLSDLGEPLQNEAVYHIQPRLCGGKGGFGSMLRALGAQIEKTTNREACRDLSGRRLRDVNHEKEMGEWLKNQAEREAEKDQRRLDKLQKKLAEPKHQFSDAKYQQQCHDLSERLEDSVMKGLQASCGSQVKADNILGSKRPNSDQNEQPKTKKKMAATYWTGIDDLLSSEEEDEEEEEGPCTSSSLCGSSSSLKVFEAETKVTGGASTSAAHSPEASSKSSTESKADGGDVDSGEVFQQPGDSKHGNVGPEQPEEGNSEPQKSNESDCNQSNAVAKSPEGSNHSNEIPKSPGDGNHSNIVPESPEEANDTKGSTGKPNDGTESSEELKQPAADDANKGSQELDGNASTRAPEAAHEPVDLSSMSTVQQLESLGLEVLKAELMSRELKCGGTLAERAARLFSIKDLTRDQIDPALFAKPSKTKRK